jgi:hypothetical protein
MMISRRELAQPIPSSQRDVMSMENLYRRKAKPSLQLWLVLQALALRQMEEPRHGCPC